MSNTARSTFTKNVFLDDPLDIIKEQTIPWEEYRDNGIISREQKEKLYNIFPGKYDVKMLHTLVSVLTSVNQSQINKYVLVIIHEIAIEKPDIFCELEDHVKWELEQRLKSLVTGKDSWIGFLACKVTAIFYIANKKVLVNKISLKENRKIDVQGQTGNAGSFCSSSIKWYFDFIENVLRNENSEQVLLVIQCISIMLQNCRETREYIVKYHMGVVNAMTVLIEGDDAHYQLQYEVLLCFWFLSFSKETLLCIKDTIPIFSDVCKNAAKEKIIRICLSIFRNMLVVAKNELISIMIGCKLLELMKTLSNRKFSDEDVLDDIDFVCNGLSVIYQGLSTFDEYLSEVRSQHLYWSPPHRSDVFWKQNSAKLDYNNYEILKVLIGLISSSDIQPQVKAIALNDLGQYVKFYPPGRKNISEFGGKAKMMELISDSHPDVRYEALMAVQKYVLNRN